MNRVLLCLIVIGIILLLLKFFLDKYNKMVLLTKEVTVNYQQFNMIIQEQVYMARIFYNSFANMSYTEYMTLRDLIEGFNSQGGVVHAIETSKGVDKEIKRLSASIPSNNIINWLDKYNEIMSRLNNARGIYNKNVKIYNNLIVMFPLNIVANTVGYQSWPIFKDFV